jgi:hypothetical protein
MSDEGELLQDADGALIMRGTDDEGGLAMGSDGDDCCDSCEIHPPIIVCGDLSSCDHWCTGKAWIYRSECCDCPCPGRKVFPECYRIDVLGVSIVARFDNGDGTYYTFDPTGPFDFEDAQCVDTQYTITWNLYAADDSFLSTGTANVETQSESASCVTTCPGAPNIQVAAFVTTGLPAGSSLLSSTTGENLGSVLAGDCCVGADGSLIANTAVSVIDNPGNFFVRPRCVQCDGTPCTGGTDPPQRCGGGIVVTFEYEAGGGVWAMAEAEINGGPCSWAGTVDIGGNVTVTTSPVDGDGNPCCPDCDCDDCGGDCGAPEETVGAACPGSCWQMTIAANGFTETILVGISSCPSGSSGYSGTHFRNIALSSAVGCR